MATYHRLAYAVPITFGFARLSMRNCPALKECPQVLHLQFAFERGGLPTPVLGRLFSLGRNAITNSPPQSMHSRLAILTLVPQWRRVCRNHTRFQTKGCILPRSAAARNQRISATPGARLGNFVNTAGSCPGIISSGREAICFMRSCARRFDAASSVAPIGTCLSRFS